jgi:hypothetical protein
MNANGSGASEVIRRMAEHLRQDVLPKRQCSFGPEGKRKRLRRMGWSGSTSVANEIPSRHFAATQYFGRFRGEADMTNL